MANMNNRVDAFISENGLDESIKDAVIELVNGCFGDYVGHMSKEWLSTPVSNGKSSASKTKKEKLEDPTEATCIEDLRKCTTIVLNQYCKNNGLKVGGNKPEISGRVWRHIQGDSSDDDVSSRSKPKKVKAAKEVHSCFSCNSKGAPCGIAATEEYSGHWFCFHHIDSAKTCGFSLKKTPKPPGWEDDEEDSQDEEESEEEPEEEPEEPVVVPEKKNKKTSKK